MNTVRPESPTATLSPQERQDLAIAALSRSKTITELAACYDVSRNFIYRQVGKAQEALRATFDQTETMEERPLFTINVTKRWLHSFVLAQNLICHASYRQVIEILRDLFGYDLSVGSVHNIVMQATNKARELQASERLEAVRVGAHDEIFQGRTPILVGADVDSSFIYLLTEEEHRDAETWAVRLMECTDKGLCPQSTVADGGTGLRAGQAIAWPGTPCHADVFHAFLETGRMASYLENRAMGLISEEDQLQRKMAKAKAEGCGNRLSKRLSLLTNEVKTISALYDDCAILSTWLREDVLACNALDLETRRANFDFIVAELHAREHLASHRIGPVRKMLTNQRNNLLAFAQFIDHELITLAAQLKCPLETLRTNFNAICHADEEMIDGEDTDVNINMPRVMKDALRSIIRRTIRASSIVENINSRLRLYISLRRRLGPAHLDLLRFFFNHRRFMRSERPERAGKSPVEILIGKQQPHWLELLGFECCQRAA